MNRLALGLAAATALGLVALSSTGAEPKPEKSAPLLIELFTSQGCSSCPPAERLFASLADDPAYVTIEWHVDYWDDLVHGGARWKDPFSSPQFTERQRAYNEAIRGTRSVYTPQAILAGAQEFVGSRPSELNAARPGAKQPSANLRVSDAELTVSGKGSGSVWFVRLQTEHETGVTSGENKGRVLSGRNIALEARKLGDWSGRAASYEIPPLSKGESCALFVQSTDDPPGPVLGAAYCPSL